MRMAIRGNEFIAQRKRIIETESKLQDITERHRNWGKDDDLRRQFECP